MGLHGALRATRSSYNNPRPTPIKPEADRSARHLRVKIRAYLVREAGEPRSGAAARSRLFPGYVNLSRFSGPKIRGYRSGDARSGCLQVFDPEALSTAGPALCRTDAGFSRVFSREIGDLLTRDRPNRAPEGAHFGDPASAAQVSRLEKRTVVARAR